MLAEFSAVGKLNRLELFEFSDVGKLVIYKMIKLRTIGELSFDIGKLEEILLGEGQNKTAATDNVLWTLSFDPHPHSITSTNIH